MNTVRKEKYVKGFGISVSANSHNKLNDSKNTQKATLMFFINILWILDLTKMFVTHPSTKEGSF
ncbi:hypothetical protein DESC_710077 [Desulfosarcina cetonica]|nr:hypothetical protein DESC_710077 [Desulfosarcina cetonica]